VSAISPQAKKKTDKRRSPRYLSKLPKEIPLQGEIIRRCTNQSPPGGRFRKKKPGVPRKSTPIGKGVAGPDHKTLKRKRQREKKKKDCKRKESRYENKSIKQKVLLSTCPSRTGRSFSRGWKNRQTHPSTEELQENRREVLPVKEGETKAYLDRIRPPDQEYRKRGGKSGFTELGRGGQPEKKGSSSNKRRREGEGKGLLGNKLEKSNILCGSKVVSLRA